MKPTLAVALLLALSLQACDAGGLLVAEPKDAGAECDADAGCGGTGGGTES